MSSANVESNLTWARSGTTITITKAAHGLTDDDFVVVRNMGDTDYVYGAISTATTNAFDITNVVNSGDTSGTEGAYIAAFDITALTDTALTVKAPSAGNCQLMSLTHFIDTMGDTSVTVTVPSNALTNGAGQNNSLKTRIPPQVRAHDLSGNPGINIGNTTIQFSTTGDYNIYRVTGGLDIFNNIIYNLQF